MNSTNHRKRILFIAYYYPPLIDVGSKRSIAFSKYFKKHGWIPYVLSVKNPDRAYCSVGDCASPPGVHAEYSYSIINLYKFFGKLNGLLAKILGVVGIELRRNYFYDIFCIPDIFWGWIPLTVLAGLRMIKRHEIDVIYASCKPFSAAVVGILLKILTKRPLVIDFRDPYAFTPKSFKYSYLRPDFRKKIDAWVESKFINYADVFIIVTEELRELYLRHYPQAKNKIFTVHNGIDVEVIPEVDSKMKYPKFTITYVGQFYSVNEKKDKIFFKAIELLKKENKIDKRNFRVLFYCANFDGFKKIVEEAGIEDFISFNLRVSHQEVLNIISKSHLLFIRALESAVPTKIFDGISMNTPLLATIPPGEAERIIKRYSPSSYVITDGSTAKIAESIHDAMEKYKKGEIRDNFLSEFYKRFSREKLTLKLMKIIEEKL